ncbi:MAG: chorismate synthase, partial [Clostridia bacterium]
TDLVELSGLDTDNKIVGDLSFYVANSSNAISMPLPITAVRSGHADLVGARRYCVNNARQVCELASARSSVAYVVTGAICKQILLRQGISTSSIVKSVGGVSGDAIKDKIIEVMAQGDSVGGIVTIKGRGVRMSLLGGDFQNYSQRLDARIASAMLGIPSVKGIEFGIGGKYSTCLGSECADLLTLDCNGDIIYATNNCGGIVAGLSTGQDIEFDLTVKPVPTIKKQIDTLDLITKQNTLSHYERADVCVVESVGVIAENILATTILNEIIERNVLIEG